MSESKISLDEIEKYALELSAVDRSDLIDRLEASLREGDGDIEPARAAVLERRIREIDEGQVQCEDMEDVIAQIQAKRHAAS